MCERIIVDSIWLLVALATKGWASISWETFEWGGITVLGASENGFKECLNCIWSGGWGFFCYF